MVVAQRPLNQVRTHAFIGSSHKDREHLDRLRGYLDLYLRGKSVDVWDDTMILTGTKWREHIKQAIDSAQAAVLLISVDFLRSKFIRENRTTPTITRRATGWCHHRAHSPGPVPD